MNRRALRRLLPASWGAWSAGAGAQGSGVFRVAGASLDQAGSNLPVFAAFRPGARAGDLAVERPTLCDLVVHLKTARALGLPIPQAMPVRAGRVIE